MVPCTSPISPLPICRISWRLSHNTSTPLLLWLGGFLFVILKGVLLCSVLLMVLNNFQLLGVVKPKVKEESKLYPYIEQTVPYVYRGFDLVKDYAKEVMPDEEDEEEMEGNSVTSTSW